LFAFAGLLATAAGEASAAGAYDPDVDYFTITTPRFYVIAPRGYENIAVRAGLIAEDVLPRIAERYGWDPAGRISLVVNDQTDFANGFAQVLPSKIVTIFVTPPTEVSGLEDYDDWLQMVITHELAHIVHLDMAYGLPQFGRSVFGKYIALNSYVAAWATEGLAVFEETVSSGAGRGRSSYVDMVLRTAALDDRFWSIDQAYRSYRYWPFGNVVYFVGGRFQLWLAKTFGEDALLEYHRYYAATAIPYLTWPAAHHAFGESLESLWSRFEDEVTAQAELTLESVRSSTMTEPIRLTEFGGQVLGPRVTPDGKSIVFSTSSPVDGPRVRLMPITSTTGEPIAVGDDRVLLNDTLSKSIAFSPKGDAFYFQQTEINQRFYRHNSLLRYGVEDSSVRRVKVDDASKEEFIAPSGSLRARDPDISRDGKRIVFVQTPYASNRLVLADLDKDGATIHPKSIVPAEPDVQLSNPRFSPDGKRIAVSRFAGGRRDVLIYDLKGEVLERITRDRAQDVSPTWSPDGRWIVFSSDRTGIYNLFAFDTDRRELRQLTNLITGAYQPCVSPDAQTIVYRGYSSDGFDVYAVPFAPESAGIVSRGLQPELTYDDTPRKAPRKTNLVVKPPPPAGFKGTPLRDLPEGWTLAEYSAFDTLLPFNDNWNLLPLVAADETQLFARLTHVGADALGDHAYSAWLEYYSRSQFVGGGATYVNNQLLPTFTLSGAASVRTFRIVDFETRELIEDFHERLIGGSFSIGLPIKQRHFISMSYSYSDRRPWVFPSQEAIERGVGFPRLGRFARVSLGYTYNNVRSFPYSISPERGLAASFALSGLSKGLGGDYEQIIFSTAFRYYLSMPWRTKHFTNHVLAMRLGLAVGGGPDLGEVFRLGGTAGSSAITTTTQNFQQLRGLRTGGLIGTGVLSAGLEYRAPIWRVERGLGTFPLVLRVIHAAVFADTGRVWDDLSVDLITQREQWEQFAVSAGGELRADVLLGWNVELELRVGWAQVLYAPCPFVEDSACDGGNPLDSSGPFFQIGSVF